MSAGFTRDQLDARLLGLADQDQAGHALAHGLDHVARGVHVVPYPDRTG